MHFSWLGNTGIKIQAKPFDKDITIVIDPYKHKVGSSPRSLAPDIALFTNSRKNSVTLSGNPFTMDTPGEIETKGILISSAQGHTNDSVMFRIDTENMSIGIIGCTYKQPTDKQLEILSGVDILCIPVGGGDCYDPEQAVKVVNTIEPKIIIPTMYKSDNDPDAKPVDAFLKEIGIKADAPEKKVIIKKKDLPQEDMHVIVLNKE